MALRMTGLMSGLDTESIVSVLMKAQTMKKTKIDNKKTKLEWKQEAWSNVNTKLYNFYKGSLSKMRLQSSFLTKAASSSNTTKLTATASSSAANGTYAVKVNKLAAAQYVTSGKLGKTTDGKKITKNTKLSDIDAGFVTGSQITVKGTKSVTLNIDDKTTVADFVSTCTKAGLTASFDEDQQRFFISSKKSGAGSSFSITSSMMSGDQISSRENLKAAVSYDSLSSSQKTTVNNILSNLQNMTGDADAISKAKTAATNSLVSISDSAAKSAVTKYYRDELTEKFEDDNSLVKTAKLDKDNNPVLDKNGNQVYVYDKDDVATRQLLLDSDKKMTDDKIDEMSQEDFDAKIKALVSKDVNKQLSSDEYKGKIADAVENGLKDNGGAFITDDEGNTLVDSKTNRDTNIVNSVNNFVTEISSGSGSYVGADPMNSLGLSSFDGSTITTDKKEGEFAGSQMSMVAAKDSEIEFNGAKLTSTQTTMTISGITLNLLGVTDGETVNINVTKDTTAVYDAIKDFLSEYNSVLQELNKNYNADAARGYDVLTDEEKEAMTDDQIEKWETKIKDSLLRRDTTLGGLVTSLRSNMGGVFKASNGKTYSLANLGITTSAKNYSEGGLLHIKGDEDDAEYADADNKLKEMLEKDPDTVMEVITGLAGNLYTELGKKMSTTRLSSALTFYNDKEMNSQLSDYKKQIKSWETKLAEMEDRYYKQFTAMEKAMASMQSQQNALSSYLGGGY